MNKIYKLAALLSVCLMAFAGCAPEELSTDQLSDENVTFAAMAPNPVARGGALRIQGSNLDKVTEVRIPGIEPITADGIIQVDSLKGRLSEIRVIVPVDGPEVGKVVIVDQDGNEYSSHTDLTYSEPIIFTSFLTENEVAYPGDVITIKGDYMNNIRAIQFGTSKAVTVFEEQSRYELKVVIPVDAVTGKVILCDVDENNNPDGKVANTFYSEKDLTIGKPVVDTKERGILKAGDIIKVTGKYLEMMQEAKFKYTAYDEDGNPYDAYEKADFTLAEVTKSITAPLSPTVTDGELLLYSYAGDEFSAGEFKTLVPSELKHSAANGYKAGNEIVITGNDLDVVTELTIGKAVTPFTYKDNALTATILGASVDGTISVKLANGKTVDAADQVTLVKPTITGISNLEFYVPDVTEVTVTGTDLDLVTEAVLGSKAVDFEVVSATEIKLLPTITSVGGKLVLKLENGVQVESAETVNVLYHSLVVVTEMPAAQHIGMEVVIKGSNMDLIENIFIGEEKVTQYSLRTPEEVRFLMPWMPVGMYDVSFHLFNGDVETQATKIEVKLELQTFVIWEGEHTIGIWDGNQDLAWGGYDWSQAKPGDILQIIGEPANPDAEWWCLSLRVGDSWGALTGVPGQYDNCTVVQVTLTKEIIDHLVSANGLVLTGQDYKFTKISIIREIPQETTLWEGEAIADDWANQPTLLSDTGPELLAVGAQAGQVLNFYIEPLAADWKLEIVEGHWGPTYCSFCSIGNDTENGKFTEYDLDANGGKYKLTLTQAMLDAAYVQQWWGGVFVLNGDNVKVTKLTIM